MFLTHGAGQLYLDLLKRCLIDSIYLDDPLADMMLYREKATTPAWKRPLIRALQSFLARYRAKLVEPHSVPWSPAYATLDVATTGGFVIVDDYYMEPCARAIHDFRTERGITDPIKDIDGRGAFWRRSSSA
jgi:Macrocin-O-methyltransferase (TylF)